MLRFFFMTAKDMENWFSEAEQKLGLSLKFIVLGLQKDKPKEYMSCLEIPSFGISGSGQEMDQGRFMILRHNQQLVFNPFTLKNGAPRFQVRLDYNPGAEYFAPSGVYHSAKFIVHGEFGSVLKDPDSKKLRKLLSTVLKKQCTTCGDTAVGNEALELHFNDGYKLGPNVGAPEICLVNVKDFQEKNTKPK